MDDPIETHAYRLGLGPPRDASLMPETDPKEARFLSRVHASLPMRDEQDCIHCRPCFTVLVCAKHVFEEA
jgi:hypothetical protein